MFLQWFEESHESAGLSSTWWNWHADGFFVNMTYKIPSHDIRFLHTILLNWKSHQTFQVSNDKHAMLQSNDPWPNTYMCTSNEQAFNKTISNMCGKLFLQHKGRRWAQTCYLRMLLKSAEMSPMLDSQLQISSTIPLVSNELQDYQLCSN